MGYPAISSTFHLCLEAFLSVAIAWDTMFCFHTGQYGLEMGFHLCHAVNTADLQALKGLASLEQVIAARLHLTHFLLFSQQQLARGTKVLAQVCAFSKGSSALPLLWCPPSW